MGRSSQVRPTGGPDFSDTAAMEERPVDDLLISGAANLAAWHDSSVRALGLATSRTSWWWTAPTPRPWIYFTAITLRPPRSRDDRAELDRELVAHLDDPRGSFQAVCETFDRVDLSEAAGAPSSLFHRTTGRWYVRRPQEDRGGEGAPQDLQIITVRDEDDLHDYEKATCAAFRAPPPVAPFEIHAPGILEDPAMHVLLARVDGDIAGGAMAYETDDMIGIYGVGVVPGLRGRGYATALTQAAMALAPDRATVLQPSAEAQSLYHRLGFEEVGRFTHWG
jgi:GNAT superfamily N-acetyltransferase